MRCSFGGQAHEPLSFVTQICTTALLGDVCSARQNHTRPIISTLATNQSFYYSSTGTNPAFSSAAKIGLI